MRITAITIENFKSIKNPVRIELKPITLLFGPNSVGKSTIIQAMHYAREILERGNVDPTHTRTGGEAIDLGGFETLVHKHDITKDIVLGFEIDLAGEGLPVHYDEYKDIMDHALTGLDKEDNYGLAPASFPYKVTQATVQITIKWFKKLGMPKVSQYKVGLNSKYLATIEVAPDGKEVIFSDFNQSRSDLFYFVKELPAELPSEIRDILKSPQGLLADFLDKFDKVISLNHHKMLNGALPHFDDSLLPISLPSSNNDDGYDDEDYLRILTALIAGPGEAVRNYLKTFCYVGPLRQVPPRNYRPEPVPSEADWSNGLAAWDVLNNSDENFLEKVNRWLNSENLLNTGYSVRVKRYKELDMESELMKILLSNVTPANIEDIKNQICSLPTRHGKLTLFDIKNAIEVAPHDIGVGISQLLPVIVAALNQDKGILAIEQPELHIHPALQVALGDLFIEQISANPKLTFLLETHSEHMLLRMLRRIEETHKKKKGAINYLTSEQMAIYYASYDNLGVRFTRLMLDETGEFANDWPEGFFEEREEELLG